MPKKVCHITNVHKRYDRRILLKECVSLVNAGYEVTLIVSDRHIDEVFEGVSIRSTGYKPKNRLQRFWTARRKIRKLAIEIDADVYHIHDPELLPLLVKLSKKGKKTVFDSHEDVPNQIISKMWIPKTVRSFISKLYIWYEHFCLKKFSAVVSVTPLIVNRLRKANESAYLVTNYPIPPERYLVDRSSLEAVGFAGGVTPNYHHAQIVEAISYSPAVRYIVAGKMTEQFETELKSFPGWEQVEYIGKIPPWEVEERVYDKIAIGMCLHLGYQCERLGGTLGVNKLFEFMSYGIPVICTNYQEWIEIVEGNNCGLCIDPTNVQQIRFAIHYLLNNRDKALEMGMNGRLAVEQSYSWYTQEKTLLDLYSRLTSDELATISSHVNINNREEPSF